MEVKGMHCQGCSNLIKMSLEDADITNVVINPQSGRAAFESEQPQSKLENSLHKVFSNLSSYEFSHVKQLD